MASPMKHVLFVVAYPGSGKGAEEKLREWLPCGVIRREIKLGWKDASDLVRDIRRACLVVLWHGDEIGNPYVREVCVEQGVPCVSCEHGLFPQQRRLIFDPDGRISNLSLLNGLPVGEVDPGRGQRVIDEHFDQLGIRRDEPDGTLVYPLQIGCDASQIRGVQPTLLEGYHWASNLAETLGLRMVVTKHPKTGWPSWVPDEERYVGSTIQRASSASIVVGINSTVLFETAALGVPTIALGQSPVRNHIGRIPELISVIAGRQWYDRASLEQAMRRIGIWRHVE